MTPKEECEKMLDALLPFALDQLKKHSEFYPFGAVLLNNDEIRLTAADTGEEYPDSTLVINQLTEAHKKQAEQENIRASGICWNATVSLENGVQTDAIIVSLEHRENYSVIVGQPYRFGFLKKLNLSNIFAQEGRHDIFD
ncbi:MAG: hypothetical protein J5874_06985 [Oscillospiraceae bacterium]|nr:hypothetical protein [Oscillospiraceae bacterium]